MAVQNVQVTPAPFTVPVEVTATLVGQAAQPTPAALAQPGAQTPENGHRWYAGAAAVAVIALVVGWIFHPISPTPAAPPPAAAAPAPAPAPAPVAVAPVVVQPVVVTPAPVVAAAPTPAPKAPRQVAVTPKVPAANINMVAGRPTLNADGTCTLNYPDGRKVAGFVSGNLCLVKTS